MSKNSRPKFHREYRCYFRCEDKNCGKRWVQQLKTLKTQSCSNCGSQTDAYQTVSNEKKIKFYSIYGILPVFKWFSEQYLVNWIN